MYFVFMIVRLIDLIVNLQKSYLTKSQESTGVDLFPASHETNGKQYSGLILPNSLPEWVTLIFPWLLMDVAAGLALGDGLPAVWPILVIATAIWSLMFIAIGLWRFRREEF